MQNLPRRPRRIVGWLVPTLVLLIATACAQPRSPSTRPSLPAEPVRPDVEVSSVSPAPVAGEERQEAEHDCGAAIEPAVIVAQLDRIQDLEARLHAQQILLEEAIQEVVRAKAKQRSIESRAEAASALAEAEIALATFRDEVGGRDAAELVRAEALLRRGTAEFESENFGGALYLTGQAKSRIRVGRLRLKEKAARDVAGDERVFSAPRRLEVATRANFRSGPGRGFEVLAILDVGTPVTGLSSKGEWIRVGRPDGATGWIHESLLRSA